MSGPVEQKYVTNGIIGSENEVKGDLITIGHVIINQNISPSLSLRKTSIWFDVRKPVESFTGRTRELEDLHREVQRSLTKNEYEFTVLSQITAISGLGGIGKSELARTYAHRHGHNYDGNVVWINAETYATLAESFHRLAKDELNILTKTADGQEKDVSFIVKEVYKYFSKTKSLFIFDNAEKLRTENKDEGIGTFLPHNQPKVENEPYIIITSRNKQWGDKMKVLSIGTLTEEEAIEFIKKVLNISDESQEKQVRQLAKILQYFPLALQQAVAYIKQENKIMQVSGGKFEINDYLNEFEKNTTKLLNFPFPDYNSNDYIKTTFITWEVTLEKIKKNEYGQKALEVLETIAYFAPDRIPKELIFELVDGNKEKMGLILILLERYSMVNLEEGVLNVHRLMQHVIRLKLKEKQQEEYETMRRAINLIRTPIEERSTYCSKYLTHAIFTWNHAVSNACNDCNKISIEELIQFSCQISSYLIIYERCEEAYAFAKQALKFLKCMKGRRKHSVLNDEQNIAPVLIRDKYKVFEEISKQTEQILGREHPTTIWASFNVALVLDRQGKYEEALKIYRENLDIEKRVLEGEHPSTLTTSNYIASVLDSQGKYDEALIIYQEVFNIRERVLGREHPNTLTTRNNMALVLNNQGKYDEALEIYRENFKVGQRFLGGEHPHTLTASHCIASVLDSQGKYDEALIIYQEVFNIRERVLFREHPNTLTTRNSMALVLINQGKYGEALEIYQENLGKEVRVLGREHPNTLTTRNNMALALDKQGKYEEALGIYREVLDIRERVLGIEHPHTLTSRHCIALVLNSQGKYNEALRFFRENLDIEKRTLGSEHPNTLTTRNNIALALKNQCKYDEALVIYWDVFTIRVRVLGGKHPNTLTTMHYIASVLDSQGKHDEALEIYQEVFTMRERVLGGEHPNTLTTWHCIASVLDSQGKHDEALEIYQEVFTIRKRVLGGEHPHTLTTKYTIDLLSHKQF